MFIFISCTFSFPRCSIFTLEYQARLVFLVFYCYVGISRTLGFFWCSIRTITFAIYRVLVNSLSKLSSRYNKIDATFFSVVVDVIFTVDTSSSGSPGLKKSEDEI